MKPLAILIPAGGFASIRRKSGIFLYFSRREQWDKSFVANFGHLSHIVDGEKGGWYNNELVKSNDFCNVCSVYDCYRADWHCRHMEKKDVD